MAGIGVIAELGLHFGPEIPVDDRRMLARMALVPVGDFTDIERVGEDLVEMPATEGTSTMAAAGLGGNKRRAFAGGSEFFGKHRD